MDSGEWLITCGAFSYAYILYIHTYQQTYMCVLKKAYKIGFIFFSVGFPLTCRDILSVMCHSPHFPADLSSHPPFSLFFPPLSFPSPLYTATVFYYLIGALPPFPPIMPIYFPGFFSCSKFYMQILRLRVRVNM